MTLTHVWSDHLRRRVQMTAASLLEPEQTVTVPGTFDAPSGKVDPGALAE